MKLRYEVDQNNEIHIFNTESDEKIIYQPTWPDGEAWSSREEAIEWAELFLASVHDELAPYPPLQRGIPGVPKPNNLDTEN